MSFSIKIAKEDPDPDPHPNEINPKLDIIIFRSRCEDFRRNFPTLPADEMLLGDYSCALQKEHNIIYLL